MIVVRAPLRLSFVGGGTDLPDFYTRHPGRVISATIDKFVYLVINHTPLVNRVSARYSTSETVNHPSELQHTRIKAALTDLGITNNIEIGSFASLPAKTGLGSSSSFSVALLKGLHEFLGKNIDKNELANAASRLEIELVGEPIGKQDQYAAAFGGLNIFTFNPDHSVKAEPVNLDYKTKADLEHHLLVFFMGTTRPAGAVLAEQKANLEQKIETMKAMADSVPEFHARLAKSDLPGLGAMLQDGWAAKKSLAASISNSITDEFYSAGMNAGAWGGKVNGAGGGGCIMFLAPAEKREAIREGMRQVAKRNELTDFCEIPVRFSQSGSEIIFKDTHFS